MLPRSARLRQSAQFRHVIRRGCKAGRTRLVVHVVTEQQHDGVRTGFVVSKVVGNSVVRHRVTRRLRHLVADRMPVLRQHSSVVVRALPPAARASSAELARDLDSALRRLSLVGGRDQGQGPSESGRS